MLSCPRFCPIGCLAPPPIPTTSLVRFFPPPCTSVIAHPHIDCALAPALGHLKRLILWQALINFSSQRHRTYFVCASEPPSSRFYPVAWFLRTKTPPVILRSLIFRDNIPVSSLRTRVAHPASIRYSFKSADRFASASIPTRRFYHPALGLIA